MIKTCLKIISLFTAFIYLPSCSFNKSFYQPDKIPANAKGQTIVYPETHDTIDIHFIGTSHQPVFIKNHRDTLDFGYTIESIVFKSSDGNEINGWLLKPEKENASITLLHIHGNGGNLYSQYPLMTPLINKGFNIFLFDYSGYGFSTGKPTKEGTFADAVAAVDYLKKREDIKTTKLVIYGQSLGGHLSAAVAAQKQASIDGLVIEGAFSSFKDIAAQRVRSVFLPGFIGRMLVTQPYSAKNTIKRYHKPVLVIHSSEDKTIPISMGKTIYNNANAPKAFYEIKGPHIRGAQLYTDSIVVKIKQMLEQ